jgi:GNAT superfamily N-acetyltransferase
MIEGQSCVGIRPFRTEDQAAARELILAGMVEYWGFLDRTRNPDLDDIATTYADGVFVCAWCGDELVGTGALVPEREGAGRIVRMSVATHLRRRGIGTKILQYLCDQARSLGYRELVLETTAWWEDAIAFYECQGFRRVGSLPGEAQFEKRLLEG